MMIRHAAFVFLLGISLTTKAQVVSDPSPTSRLLLKISPLSLLDPRTSVLQLGLEYRPVPQLGLSLDYGQRLALLRRSSYAADAAVRYLRLRSEVRYYFPIHERRAWFPAVEGFYVPLAKNTNNSAYYRDGTLYSYDRARLQQQVWGICLKYGLMQRIGPRWWLEGSTGLGIRWVNSRYGSVENEQLVPLADADRYERGWGFVPGNPDPGREAKAHMALSLKIGYTLVSR